MTSQGIGRRGKGGHSGLVRTQKVPSAEPISYVASSQRHARENGQLCDVDKILNRMYSPKLFFFNSRIFWLREPCVALWLSLPMKPENICLSHLKSS